MQDDIKPPSEPNQADGPAKTSEPVKSSPDQQVAQPPAAKQPVAQDPAKPDDAKGQGQKPEPKPEADMPVPEALKNQPDAHKESHLGPIILAIILLIFLAAVAIVSETQTDF